MRTSLHFRLLFGFFIVLAPIVAFLFYNNMYAMKVVRSQVTQSTNNLLTNHVSQMDKQLDETNNYLLKLATYDEVPYRNLIDLSVYPSDKGEYFLAKQSILNKFYADRATFKQVDTFFAYVVRTDDLIATEESYEKSQSVSALIRQALKNNALSKVVTWEIVQNGNQNFIIKIDKVNSDVLVGALIDMKSLMLPTDSSSFGKNSEALLLSTKGVPLTPTTLTREQVENVKNELFKPDNKDYKTYFDAAADIRYLLVGTSFRWAPVNLVVLVPESMLLEQLPYFQRAISFIPLGVAIIIVFFSVMLKQVLLKPMNILIKGMRRISQGDLEVRIHDNHTKEFGFLMETFNHMVDEIRSLKIDVYEEQLKGREAEYRHLQAQINPHFFLNSLNIVYSLASLKQHDLVQKMAEHLAEYFRFIMRTNRDDILLSEEMELIYHYLEIQKLRFPNKLAFRLHLPETCESCVVPPLTVQPFVENAIKHGMDKGKTMFFIELEIRSDEQDPEQFIQIRIADNGRGFSEDSLHALQTGLYAVESGDQHIGIWNVHRRLMMRYGEKFQMKFENGAEKGAVVRIRIPIERRDR
jgi:two-component system sensor histidine kinase YesM